MFAPRHPRSSLASLLVCLAASLAGPGSADAADDVFVYSSASQIRGLNLTLGTDRLLTTSPIASAANALAVNSIAGFVYYGDQTRVYRWDPALGAGAAAHSLMMDFATGPVLAPITELNSTAGSFLDNVYYVGSEAGDGTIEELYALQMSLDGTQVVSATALGLLDACNCTPADLGGFGDVAAIEEGGTTVLFGSSSAIGTGGSLAGRWKFTPSSGQFAFLATAQNGQMSTSLDGRLYSNVGNAVREVDPVTGATGSATLFTTSRSIFDFTSGFELDFGDAPDSYGSAFHRLGAGATVHVGALAPDNEPGSLNAITGLADGAGDDAEGIDDEDAIASAAPVALLSGAHAITVDCPVGTRVAGWIDLDRDGRFDAGERNDNHPVSCTAAGATLEWTSLAGAVAGDSWLRLRASSNVSAISSPVGIASDGEAEDHPIAIDAPLAGSCPVGSTSTVYGANDLPRSIGPDAGTVTTSTIQVPSGTGTVSDVKVLGVQGTHTYINDLRFSLTHAGETQNLYGYSCGSQNDFAFSFDDAAAGSPSCPPTDGGTYLPTQPLSAFDGAAADGAWELRINDRANADGGSLAGWSLELCAIDVAPELRLGKRATIIGREVTLAFAVQNVGNVALTDVQIIDDLDAVFGNGNYAVTAAPVVTAGPASANASFDGAASTALLAASASLDIGERIELTVSVRVDTLSGSPVGSYSNSATATADANGTSVSDTSDDGLDLSSDGSAPTPIVLSADTTLAGRVFIDTSAMANAAHDGLRQAGEAGLGGLVVDLLDAGGSVLASVTTDGDGRWQLALDAAIAGTAVTVAVRARGDLTIVSEAPPWRDAAPADGRLTLTPGAGIDVTGLDIGLVEASTLEVDRVLSGAAGTSVLFAHRYVSSTHGELSLTLSSLDALERRALEDTDCDGTPNEPSTVFATSRTVISDEVVCLVVEVFLPSSAIAGAVHEHRIEATLALADPAATGHAVSNVRENRDRVTVLATGQGRLVLEKRVRNLSRNEAFETGNSGLPGETLEYDIVYRNDGDGPLSELEIDDLAPAYSALVAGSVICQSTPASLACTPIVGGSTLGWRFTGALAPGEAGVVRYRVTID